MQIKTRTKRHVTQYTTTQNGRDAHQLIGTIQDLLCGRDLKVSWEREDFVLPSPPKTRTLIKARVESSTNLFRNILNGCRIVT